MSGRRSWRQAKVGGILIHRLGAAGKRLLRDADAYASAQGWTLQVRCGGLAREYRDPRFDLLARCQACRGAGGADGQRCRRCRATGRITVGQPPLTRGRAA